MTIESLPTGMKKHYTAITEYIKKHPESSVTGAAKATGSAVSMYYQAKSRLNAVKIKGTIGTTNLVKRVYVRKNVTTPAVIDTARPLVCIVGSSADVITALKGLL